MEIDSTQKILNVYKPIGQTSGQLVAQIKEVFFDSTPDIKIGYAGRLDPVAHGVMILMIGDECKRRDYYQALSKVYRFQVVFGVTTDTYDTLGILAATPNLQTPNRRTIEKKLQMFQGTIQQAYPPYSSYHIDGEPMYKLAKEGRLPHDLPTKEVHIESLELLDLAKVKFSEIRTEAIRRAKITTGEFRQSDILSKWDGLPRELDYIDATVATFQVDAASGTYVRSIAHTLGEEVGCGAIAFDILRTRVGSHSLSESVKIDAIG